MTAKILSILKEFRQKWILLMICAGVVTLSYYVLFSHYKNSYWSFNSDLVYKIESKLLDLRFKIRGPVPTTGKVGILAIDEQSVTKFGDWPFSRKYYEQAFKNLKKIGVQWIGFDAIYPEFEKTKLLEVKRNLARLRQSTRSSIGGEIDRLEGWMENSPGDLSFARGISSFKNIVLGFFFFGSFEETVANLGKNKKVYFMGLDKMKGSQIDFDLPEGKSLGDFRLLKKAYGLKANIDTLSEATSNFAFFSNDADDDAINRWVTLIANVDGNLMPSLSLKMAAEYLNSDVVVFFDDLGVESIALVNREDDSKAIEIITDPSGAGRLLVNHRGPSQSFFHYSLADAYFNKFSKKQKEELKGSVLLLGGTATGTNDLRPNVYDPAIDGVENHAAVIDNIIRQDYLKRPVDIFKIELLIVLAVGLLFAPLMIWGSSIISGIAVVIFLIGYWYVDWTFWFMQGTWAYIAIPSMEIIGMFITTTLFKYATEENEKKKVKGAFEHYLSPDVIQQVLEDPTSLSLGGSRKEITVFFSDVRGFTTISESLSPEKLCEFMNEYFTPMTGIILESGGTLDKYIGDAIMAFWGAPVPMPNHPAVAANASIQMMFALDRLQHDMPAKGFPKPDIGIGLNTGPMSVGNMGSAARFSFTVMGDSVNLGARLEGLTKEYKIKIMISEFTAKHLTRDQFFFRDLDDIRVKGKNEPVKVFELMRPDLVPNRDALNNLVGEFELGRSAYREQNWEEAGKRFLECLKIRPDDGPGNLYLQRVEEYKANSPGKEWDGVYTFTHK